MKRSADQQKTIDSFKKLNQYLYTLNYQNDYSFDKIIDSGVSNMVDLVKMCQKELKVEMKTKGGKNDGFACSAFNAVTPDGDHILARNFDYMAAPLVVVWTAPKNGYKSISVDTGSFMLFGNKSMAEMKESAKNRLLMAPYACMDGVNEKGLAIAVLEIKTKATKQQTGKKPFMTTLAIRGTLDKCATVDEAVEFFKKYDMHDSMFCNYHFIITDKSGKTVIIEYVNNNMTLHYSEEGQCQCLANFFISEGGDNSKGFGHIRYDYMEKVLKENNIKTEADAMKMMENVRLEYKHDRGYMIITLWSAIFNVEKGTMNLCNSLDYENVYKFSIDKPNEFVKVARESANVPDLDFKHKDPEMDTF